MAKIVEEKILIKFSMLLPDSVESDITVVDETIRKNIEDNARALLGDVLTTLFAEEENIPNIIVEAVIVDHNEAAGS